MDGQRHPMPERNDESGRYTDEYPREAFLDALRTLDGAGGTSEIASEVGCIRETAYKKLRAMRDDGLVTSRDVGGSLLWMLPADNDEDGE
jgi:GTP-sensing pleiotropic transcriptional regulator CodY